MNTSAQTDRRPVRVNDREQLIYLLTEAAEIEHGLMCTYLYAGWSLKRATSEGVTPGQLEVIERWRHDINNVAKEEMGHLAMVNNLLMSIGSAPHFRRQNFPVPPGYHPSSLVLRLAPLNRATLQHFIYLERPEGMAMEQAPGFEAALAYERGAPRATLTPTAEEFDTVGHLYRGIEDGFAALSAAMGESALFAGDPGMQLEREQLALEGMFGVFDLASARQAVDIIVAQGEGGRSDAKASHFARFQAMAREYDAFLAADASFVPHRPVVSDPVMFAPIEEQGTTQVSAPLSAAVLDLANASYGLMLRLLASGTGVARMGEPLRQAELDAALSLMHVIDKLAVLLTTLPVAAAGSITAGMNFHLPRTALALPQRDAGAALLAERASEIALAIGTLEAQAPQLSAARERVLAVARILQEFADQSPPAS